MAPKGDGKRCCSPSLPMPIPMHPSFFVVVLRTDTGTLCHPSKHLKTRPFVGTTSLRQQYSSIRLQIPLSSFFGMSRPPPIALDRQCSCSPYRTISVSVLRYVGFFPFGELGRSLSDNGTHGDLAHTELGAQYPLPLRTSSSHIQGRRARSPRLACSLYSSG